MTNACLGNSKKLEYARQCMFKPFCRKCVFTHSPLIINIWSITQPCFVLATNHMTSCRQHLLSPVIAILASSMVIHNIIILIMVSMSWGLDRKYEYLGLYENTDSPLEVTKIYRMSNNDILCKYILFSICM